jgi:ATP-dependent DNA helicase RecG
LVVVDEQHRFGVEQRRIIKEKGRGAHFLSMTATPIPRSLALTIYGDLDVTTLDELPPGRAPPRTRVLSGARGRKSAYALLAKTVDAGGRGFVVCPLVAPSPSPSDDVDWVDATTTAERLAVELAPRRVGLVHGRIPAADRDAAMARLRSGELDVLVATTVIEVGVDVPAARIMIVEDADRFGLAQLHQLRGRVGRGGGEAHCLLLTRGTRTSDVLRRLDIMEATGDGFRIAEEDLALRGEGDVLGTRQSGMPGFRVARIEVHGKLIGAARDDASLVLARDPTLASERGQALRHLLYLFERDEAIRLIRAG